MQNTLRLKQEAGIDFDPAKVRSNEACSSLLYSLPHTVNQQKVLHLNHVIDVMSESAGVRLACCALATVVGDALGLCCASVPGKRQIIFTHLTGVSMAMHQSCTPQV